MSLTRIPGNVPIIHGLEIKPGTRGRGFLEVGPYYDNTAGATVKIRKFVRIPFTVIRGVEDGPTLCITGGTHPTEYGGINAAIRVSNEVKVEDLKGRLIVVPVVNMPGFWDRNYLCPTDGVNISISYKKGGKSDGTLGEMIAFRILHQILSKSDYWIDFHGSDTSELHMPIAAFDRIGDTEIDAKSEAIAKALGIEADRYLGDKGVNPPIPGIKPIPKAVCEVGPGDSLSIEMSSILFEGLLNVMSCLKMIKGECREKEYTRVVQMKMVINHQGLFYVKIKPGDIVEKDQVVGEVRNLEGDLLETIRNPYDKGVLVMMIRNPVVFPGEKIGSIGIFQK